MGFSRNQNQVRPFNQKQKLLIGDIKQSVEVFIKDYNNYFFENFFSKIFGNLQNHLYSNNVLIGIAKFPFNRLNGKNINMS